MALPLSQCALQLCHSLLPNEALPSGIPLMVNYPDCNHHGSMSREHAFMDRITQVKHLFH